MIRSRAFRHVTSKVRALSFRPSSLSFFSTEAFVDTCDLHIVNSPFPPIADPPYPPVTEFISADWKSNKQSEKVAIIDGTTGQKRTFGDYNSDMTRIAASLRDLGIVEESTVSLFTPNHVDYAPISLAVALCGAKLTPCNPLYTAEELALIMQMSNTEVLIAHASVLDKALAAAKDCKHVRHIITIPEYDDGAVPYGTLSLDSLKDHDEPLRQTVRSVHNSVSSHPFLLPFSSGTTGLPKGVCLSHSNLVANLLQFDEVEGLSFPSDHRLISPLPFFHIYGWLASMMYCAWRGQEVITMSRFDFEGFCKLVEEHKPQRAHIVPPIVLGLAKHPIVDKFDMSSLIMALSAAAPLDPETEKAAVDRIDCEIKQAWGMSELSPVGALNSDYNVKPGSVGQLVSSTYGKILDPETEKSLGPGETGELCVKGPQVMMGYLNDPEKTAACISKDGWLKTGDIGYYDEEGFFFITDRLKELIKVKGFQVAPAELEGLLLQNEHVKDAAVVPIKDEEAGELPRAFVVLKDGEESNEISEEDIAQWVGERVAPHKRLKGGVIFIDEIPKSASGKILRRILRDQCIENSSG
uniref:4-coumarate--CoA ligase n=1 Tax=Helicotheca tamesis TaxID=374047 RepID=A0A7S2IGE4_9STRA|mmetsp:Transcript_9187/g.12772  ORF Transcript_9187/g.12772 Transcript_9187/m.12772 type:complete len:581 (+) Transcript_9187:88-1830(+)|eukprot:CAMPEP_0185740568 /NCGR_PEP_ID=MMETSP1171-20130828/38067_1 /TAXON_ID=374046 /ORGANISM="Helicotheca tamensis, Strain CCMP826" /LENGTH=580 /DNA_ID=CAMNT_0028412443 /DNA_START=29 /DNA_END=1771 /DNA_ORIENTATION=-